LALLISLRQDPNDNAAEMQQNAALKKYSSVWDQLQLRDQRLVRVPPPYSDASSKVQVVLPKVLVASVLNQLHSSVTGGHLGIQKLQEKVRDRFYWPGWFADVRQWCRQCVDCASRKTHGKAPCAPMHSSVTSRPHERIALDILGPLPETPRKHKYILVYYWLNVDRTLQASKLINFCQSRTSVAAGVGAVVAHRNWPQV